MAEVINSDLYKEYFNVFCQLSQKYKTDRIVILYQIGDFYEIYGPEDYMYKICYQTLDINSRKITTETNVYTGGFPIKAIKKYSKLLTFNEYLVVICDQADSPDKKNKKIRVVSEIQTVATTMDEEVLGNDSKLLMSIYLEYEDGVLSETSICYMDASTGSISCITDGISSYSEILRIIKKLSPKQIIVNTEDCKLSQTQLSELLSLDGKLTHIYINEVDKMIKKIAYVNIFLKAFYPQKLVPQAEYLGIDKYPSLITSFILMLTFVNEFNKIVLSKLQRPKLESYGNQLTLSDNAIEQLNLIDESNEHSLFKIINKTLTPGGRRSLKTQLLNHIIDPEKLKER